MDETSGCTLRNCCICRVCQPRHFKFGALLQAPAKCKFTDSGEGRRVHRVEEFTYLGSIQSSKSNSRPEYIRCIGLVASALKRLDCVWSQSKLSITMKLRIYSTCVLPILLYGSETWTLIQANWNKLDSFRVRCQRRIMHIIFRI